MMMMMMMIMIMIMISIIILSSIRITLGSEKLNMAAPRGPDTAKGVLIVDSVGQINNKDRPKLPDIFTLYFI